MKKFLILLGIILPEIGITQPLYEWTNTGTGWFQGFGEITVDSHGNSYITGDYVGPVDFDPGPDTNTILGNGSNDFFVSKYDPNGNYLWTKGIGGAGGEHGFTIKTDEFDNIYCVGQFNDSIDFNPGGPSGMAYSYSTAMFILKLDTSGNFIWVKYIPCTYPSYVHSTSIFVKSNIIYVGGTFKSTVDFDPGTGTFNLTASNSKTDAFLLKLDDQGNFIWAKKWGGSLNDGCHKIAVDNNLNIYCTGSFEGTADFNPNPGSNSMTVNSNFYDGYILKLDANGNFKWAKQLHTDYSGKTWPIDIHSDNIIYVGGVFNGNIDFNSTNPALHFNTPNQNYVLIRLDSLGNINWGKQLIFQGCGSYFRDLVVDSSDNVFVTGAFCNSLNLDYGFSNFTLSPPPSFPNSDHNSFIAKYDPSGTFQWGLGQYGDYYAQGYGLDIDPNGSLYYLGDFAISNVKLNDNNGPINLSIANTSSSDPCFIVKISECNTYSYGSISVTECGSYTSPSQNFSWSTSGTYTDILPNARGCDSIITINLTILPYGFSSVDTSTCNTYISPGGQNLITPGIYYDTLANPPNCDSVIQINFTVPSDFLSVDTTACDLYVSPGGQNLISSGVYYDTLASYINCDSIIEINLTINSVNTNVSVNGTTLQSLTSGASYQWVDCNNNMSIITDATQQTYIPDINGSYAVVITTNNCSDTSACYAVNTVGINASTENNITIYPNPNTGIFSISGISATQPFSIIITDMEGRMVFEKKYMDSKNISVQPNLSSGMYWVEIKNDDILFNTKLVIE